MPSSESLVVSIALILGLSALIAFAPSPAHADAAKDQPRAESPYADEVEDGFVSFSSQQHMLAPNGAVVVCKEPAAAAPGCVLALPSVLLREKINPTARLVRMEERCDQQASRSDINSGWGIVEAPGCSRTLVLYYRLRK